MQQTMALLNQAEVRSSRSFNFDTKHNLRLQGIMVRGGFHVRQKYTK